MKFQFDCGQTKNYQKEISIVYSNGLVNGRLRIFQSHLNDKTRRKDENFAIKPREIEEFGH